MKYTKCLIIGAGPAGFTAAIYAAKSALHPILITDFQVSGQLTQTTAVDNFPGYPEGILGVQLMGELKRQSEQLGTQIINEEVTHVDFSDRPFKVTTAKGEQFLSDTIIIATGATAKWLGLGNESKYDGGGVVFEDDISMDSKGYIKTIPGTSMTSIPGVFACGDVQDSEYRQAITAAGSGCMAAIDAARYLSSRINKNGFFCLEYPTAISTILTRNGISCIETSTAFSN